MYNLLQILEIFVYLMQLLHKTQVVQLKFLDYSKFTSQMALHHFLGLMCVLPHFTWMKEKRLVSNLDMKDYTTMLPPVLQFLTQQRTFLGNIPWK